MWNIVCFDCTPSLRNPMVALITSEDKFQTEHGVLCECAQMRVPSHI